MKSIQKVCEIDEVKIYTLRKGKGFFEFENTLQRFFVCFKFFVAFYNFFVEETKIC